MTPARALPSRAPISNLSRCGSVRTPAAYGCADSVGSSVRRQGVVPRHQAVEAGGELPQLLVFAQKLDHTSFTLGFGEAGWKTRVDLLPQSPQQIQGFFGHRRYRRRVFDV